MGVGVAATVVPGCRAEAVNGTTKGKRKPNIIYILTDDLGYAEVGCYGQKKIKTPNIDRLAKEGMKFTQHYSGSPVCAPSRCTLMTGLHTGHAQVRNNKQTGGSEGWKLGSTTGGQHPLKEGTVTVAKLLKDVGYKTGAYGKWGLGTYSDSGAPDKQGFDHFYGYICQRQAHTYYPNHLWNDGKVEWIPENENGGKVKYSHDLISEQALKFIKKYKDQPFFCYVPFTIPHVALEVPEDSLNEYKGKWDDPAYDGGKGYFPHPHPRAAYAAMVTRMDGDVGRIMDLVRKLDLEDDTIIIFTSDNGPTFNGGSDSEFFESAGPFRGLKVSAYEGGIRVPFIAKWPGKIKANTTSDHISAMWDMLPTFCDVAGTKTPADIDGLSMLNVLTGKDDQQKKHEYLYWELGGQQAIRMGDYKAYRRNRGKTELYNLGQDIGEQNDIADKMPDLTAKMTKLFETARTESDVFKLPQAGKSKKEKAAGLSTDRAIPKDGWKLVSVSSESKFNSKDAIKAFDGDVDTWWHSEFQENKPTHPHEIVIDLGKSYKLEGFRYLPRTDAGKNGMIKQYEFFAGTSKDGLKRIAKGRFKDSKAEQQVVFKTPADARYIKLVSLSSIAGDDFATIAELSVFGQ